MSAMHQLRTRETRAFLLWRRMSVAQVADTMQCSVSTARRWILGGRLTHAVVCAERKMEARRT